MILQDFFDRKSDILDQLIEDGIDSEKIATVIFSDLLDHKQTDINDYLKFKQLNEKSNAK